MDTLDFGIALIASIVIVGSLVYFFYSETENTIEVVDTNWQTNWAVVDYNYDSNDFVGELQLTSEELILEKKYFDLNELFIVSDQLFLCDMFFSWYSQQTDCEYDYYGVNGRCAIHCKEKLKEVQSTISDSNFISYSDLVNSAENYSGMKNCRRASDGCNWVCCDDSNLLCLQTVMGCVKEVDLNKMFVDVGDKNGTKSN